MRPLARQAEESWAWHHNASDTERAMGLQVVGNLKDIQLPRMPSIASHGHGHARSNLNLNQVRSPTLSSRYGHYHRLPRRRRQQRLRFPSCTAAPFWPRGGLGCIQVRPGHWAATALNCRSAAATVSRRVPGLAGCGGSNDHRHPHPRPGRTGLGIGGEPKFSWKLLLACFK